MSALTGKRILMVQQRNWALTIGHFLAKKLQAEGCRLAALTLKKTTHAFVLAQQEVAYDLIVNNDEIMEDPAHYLAGRDISLQTICANLGIDSVWPLVASLRNHVRSYKDKFYYGFKQNVPDEEIIQFVKATYLYIEKIFADFHPDLIIGPNFVALPHLMLNLYAERKNVQMLTVTDTKVKGQFVFVYDFIETRCPLFPRLRDLNGGLTSPHLEKAKNYIKNFRETYARPSYGLDLSKKTPWTKSIRHALSPYRQIWNWYANPQTNVLKNTGITPDYRPPSIILRDHYAERAYRKYMAAFPYKPLERIGPCVYFPLQTQPELSIDVIAPYFNNQIEVARLLAMSLPDDYTLIVKEHPAMVGLRPPSYIEKLARSPNVTLVDYRIPNDVALKKADLVISPNSTTLAEAAFYYKPAIQLGNLGTTLAFPNVTKQTDMTTISMVIKKLLARDLHTDAYERQLENYVAAAYDTGFDIPYFSIWEKGFPSKASEDQLWDIYQRGIAEAFSYAAS